MSQGLLFFFFFTGSENGVGENVVFGFPQECEVPPITDSLIWMLGRQYWDGTFPVLRKTIKIEMTKPLMDQDLLGQASLRAGMVGQKEWCL